MSATLPAGYVMAYGDNGLELTPESEAVEIHAIPFGPSNLVIPETVAFLAATRDGGRPTRLIQIDPPTAQSKHPYPLVRFACTPFVRLVMDDVTHMGEELTCYLLSSKDATHPIFADMPAVDRERIAAVFA